MLVTVTRWRSVSVLARTVASQLLLHAVATVAGSIKQPYRPCRSPSHSRAMPLWMVANIGRLTHVAGVHLWVSPRPAVFSAVIINAGISTVA